MILEAILMLTVGLTGLALLVASGVSGPILAPLGFLVGTGVYIALGSLQIVSGVSTNPLWTMGATAATGLVVGAVARWKGRWKSGLMVPLATVLIILVSVWAFRTLNFIGWHSDSIRYLLVGSLIGGRKLWPRFSPNKTWSGFIGGLIGGLAALPFWDFLKRIRPRQG